MKESLHLLAPRLKAMSSLRVSDMDLNSFFKVLDYSVVPGVELGLGCYSARFQVESKRAITRAVSDPTKSKRYQLLCCVFLQSFGSVPCSACTKLGNEC
jgi:hypothetical protein